ncbi:MAG TPA: magnesium transporter [Deltaproteobacteria bacterium]|nr:magnesium transporter [Deltaproteobacteria bacterium]
MSTFQTTPIDEKLIETVKTLIQQKDRPALLKFMDDTRAADTADLIEHLDPEDRLYIFKLLGPEGAGDVLVEIEASVQESIISDLDNSAISEIVEELDSDDAADIVGDLPDERAKKIIEAVEDHVSDELEKLLTYPEDSAGGIMALEFVAVRAASTVREAIEILRTKRDEVENVYYIFVVDQSNRLVGAVSLKDLILEPPERMIRDIMDPEIISVSVDQDQEEAYHLVKKYDLVSLPVVDAHHCLVGRITHDDIIDVIEEEADEDMAFMAGVIDQEFAEESSIKVSRARLPWLIAGLFGGILAAAVIDQFESSLEKILALSFFFPVIMAMGGNTGTQAATVAVRGLATGDISMLKVGKRLWLEMRVAMFNGIICGILLGLIVGVWLKDFRLGSVVSLAVVLIILNSGFIGAAVPLALKRLNIDPALATGPIVTTSNDVLSLLIYLGFVTLFLHVSA